MRRFIAIMMSFLVALATIAPAVALADENKEISVYLNGKRISFDVAPQIINNRTMVPVRGVFEAYGMNVYWDDYSRTVLATSGKSESEVTMTIGSNRFKRGYTTYTTDTPAVIVSDRTLVPVRAISESLGATVTWDDNARRVSIVTSITGDGTLPYGLSDGTTSTTNTNYNDTKIEPTKIAFDSSSETIYLGETLELDYTLTPKYADTTLTWKSSNESVATVTSAGKVKGKKAGTATITLTTSNNKSCTCKITVENEKIEPTGVKFTSTSVTMTEGESKTLSTKMIPSNAYEDLTFESSNTSVATVGKTSGTVKAVKAGTAKITVTTHNGYDAECTVTVNPVVNPTGVTLNKSSLSLDEGKTETLTATVTPTDATNKTVTWSSSNTTVAAVDSSGKVTAKKSGTSTITVKNSAGNTATCTVTVKDDPNVVKPSGVSLNKTALSLAAGAAETLVATVTPANAANKTVSWTSSNTSVATVDANGKVTALRLGSTTVTAKSFNDYKATCTVTVSGGTVTTSGACGTSANWKLYADGTLHITGTGPMTDYTTDGAIWNTYSSSIKSIIIDEGITTIGEYAFEKCSSATDIEIPKSITKSGTGAFKECSSVQSVHISDIDAWCKIDFADSSSHPCNKYNKYSQYAELLLNGTPVSNVTIPSGLTSVKQYSFYKCNTIEEVVIPEGVTTITNSAFYKCNNLQSIQLPESLRTIGNNSFWGCNSLSEIQLPETLKRIETGAFCYCNNLTEVNIPKSVISVESSAFFGCSELNSVTLNEGLVTIGSYAFCQCSKLKSIVIPASVTTMGYAAFGSCESLETVDIASSVRSIPDNAFYDCTSLKTVKLHDGLEEIGANAFKGCSKLSTIVLPSTLLKIGSCAFYLCDELVSIDIPAGVNYILYSAFYECSKLRTVTFKGNSIRAIPASAFEKCSRLESIVIPDGVIIINQTAFKDCLSLKNVVIPTSTTTIEQDAFADCYMGATVRYKGNSTSWSAINIDTGNRCIQDWASTHTFDLP